MNRDFRSSFLPAFCFLPFAFAVEPLAFTILGVGVLFFVAYDVYATILDARSQAGPLSETLNRNVWRVARWVGFRLSRPRRHRILNFVGPLLLPTLIIIYLILLISGFALIYYPRMPAQFNVPGGASTPTWAESIYFSGTSLTTLGFGDITPRTVQMRLVALIEAATGFGLISLAVTYLLSVYGALEHKRVVALSIYHQSDEGANVASLISYYFIGGRFHGLDASLRAAARDLQSLNESHVEHPIIHYFHPFQVYKSLPRVLFLTLETCSVIQSCLDEETYAELRQHPEVRTLAATGRHVLVAMVEALNLETLTRRRKELKFEEARRWKARYDQTFDQLIAAGISTRRERHAGYEDYRAQREEWEAKLYRLAGHLGYDWDEITGDRDLQYAADEEMEQPRP